MIAKPRLLVAGETNSPPGAATQRNVARWLSGIERSTPEIVGLVVRFSSAVEIAAESAKSIGAGVTVVPATEPSAVTRSTRHRKALSAGVASEPTINSYIFMRRAAVS